MDLVQEVDFADTASYLGTWSGESFGLRLFDVGKRDSMGKAVLSYSFFDLTRDPSVVFTGEDFAVSPLHAVDSPEAAASLLSFLALEPGDTDDEYFATYTPEQRDWLESGRAQDLKMIVLEMEELAARPNLTDVDVEPGPLSRPSHLSDQRELEL